MAICSAKPQNYCKSKYMSLREMICYVLCDHAGSGSSYPFHMDVMHSRPFVPSVLSRWRVKMALSNLYSQQMNNFVNKKKQKTCTALLQLFT